MFYDDLYAFYDLINPGRDEEHAYYRNLIAETDDVLEVACGSGSLTSEIAKFARSVVGIDISPKMLEIARLRVPGAEFLETDMRSFEVDKIFDKVICPFNSFMHMHSDKDAVAALSLFRAHCKPTGQIVVDMFDIDGWISSRSNIPVQRRLTGIIDTGICSCCSCGSIMQTNR